jgi:carbonic anhydrase
MGSHAAKAEQTAQIVMQRDLNTLLPADKTYWRFSDALTIPACSEGVP